MREITARAIWFWNFTSSASTLEQSFCFAFPLLFIRAAFVGDSVGSAQKLWTQGWVFPSNMKLGVDEIHLLCSSALGEGAVASRVCVCSSGNPRAERGFSLPTSGAWVPPTSAAPRGCSELHNPTLWAKPHHDFHIPAPEGAQTTFFFFFCFCLFI